MLTYAGHLLLLLPQVCRSGKSKFTCFTSTIGKILTLTHLPGAACGVSKGGDLYVHEERRQSVLYILIFIFLITTVHLLYYFLSFRGINIICVYVYMHMQMYVCMYTRMCVYLRVCVCVCACACVCVCVCVCIVYIYICIYIHMYTYISKGYKY
jgi:hypothetical protein